METNSYIGISRPLGEYDKMLLSVVESNLNYFNRNKRKGVLTVNHYVDQGDQWEILCDGNVVFNFMTLKEMFVAVATVIRYEERMGK